MTKKTAWLIFIFSGLALILALLIVGFAPSNNDGFKDSAPVLTFVGGAAVAIERVIETFWTFMGGVAGTYWPLNLINKQVNAMVGELDNSMQPIYSAANANIDKLAAAEGWAEDKINEAKAEVANLENRFNELKNQLPPDNERVQLLVAAASQHADYLKSKYKDVTQDIERYKGVADASINGLQNFIASFKDNPGRRLISIFMGMILGLAVAGYFGLDLFQAILAQQTARKPGYIILTGLVMGLGASPTHEVIRVLQEYKKAKKGENLKTPDQPDTQER